MAQIVRLQADFSQPNAEAGKTKTAFDSAASSMGGFEKQAKSGSEALTYYAKTVKVAVEAAETASKALTGLARSLDGVTGSYTRGGIEAKKFGDAGFTGAERVRKETEALVKAQNEFHRALQSGMAVRSSERAAEDRHASTMKGHAQDMMRLLASSLEYEAPGGGRYGLVGHLIGMQRQRELTTGSGPLTSTAAFMMAAGANPYVRGAGLAAAGVYTASQFGANYRDYLSPQGSMERGARRDMSAQRLNDELAAADSSPSGMLAGLGLRAHHYAREGEQGLRSLLGMKGPGFFLEDSIERERTDPVYAAQKREEQARQRAELAVGAQRNATVGSQLSEIGTIYTGGRAGSAFEPGIERGSRIARETSSFRWDLERGGGDLRTVMRDLQKQATAENDYERERFEKNPGILEALRSRTGAVGELMTSNRVGGISAQQQIAGAERGRSLDTQFRTVSDAGVAQKLLELERERVKLQSDFAFHGEVQRRNLEATLRLESEVTAAMQRRNALLDASSSRLGGVAATRATQFATQRTAGDVREEAFRTMNDPLSTTQQRAAAQQMHEAAIGRFEQIGNERRSDIIGIGDTRRSIQTQFIAAGAGGAGSNFLSGQAGRGSSLGGMETRFKQEQQYADKRAMDAEISEAERLGQIRKAAAKTDEDRRKIDDETDALKRQSQEAYKLKQVYDDAHKDRMVQIEAEKQKLAERASIELRGAQQTKDTLTNLLYGGRQTVHDGGSLMGGGYASGHAPAYGGGGGDPRGFQPGGANAPGTMNWFGQKWQVGGSPGLFPEATARPWRPATQFELPRGFENVTGNTASERHMLRGAVFQRHIDLGGNAQRGDGSGVTRGGANAQWLGGGFGGAMGEGGEGTDQPTGGPADAANRSVMDQIAQQRAAEMLESQEARFPGGNILNRKGQVVGKHRMQLTPQQMLARARAGVRDDMANGGISQDELMRGQQGADAAMTEMMAKRRRGQEIGAEDAMNPAFRGATERAGGFSGDISARRRMLDPTDPKDQAELARLNKQEAAAKGKALAPTDKALEDYLRSASGRDKQGGQFDDRLVQLLQDVTQVAELTSKTIQQRDAIISNLQQRFNNLKNSLNGAAGVNGM